LNDTITPDFLEEVMDRCRYFAEACDHLSTIEILTEHCGGVSGLTTSLLEAIREEYGNSVSIPLWSISDRTENAAVMNYRKTAALFDPTSMKSKVSVLDNALFFHGVAEYCSCVVPISTPAIWASLSGGGGGDSAAHIPPGARHYVSAAVAAAAIETASTYYALPDRLITGYEVNLFEGGGDADDRQSQSQSQSQSISQHLRQSQQQQAQRQYQQNAEINNASQWCAAATLRGRLPVCFLEASFPGILHLATGHGGSSSSGSSSGGRGGGDSSSSSYSGLDQYLLDCFAHSSSSSSSSSSKALSRCVRTTSPFAVALSPVPALGMAALLDSEDGEGNDGGGSSSSHTNSSIFPYSRTFTNLVSARGIERGSTYSSVLFNSFARPPK
jgi:hypothetical protein